MYRSIVVPLDGSAAAERALPFAEALARRGGARLLLVQAVNVHAMVGADPTEAQVQALAEARAYLDETAARGAGQGIAVDTAVPYGPPAEEIVAEVRLRGADLVVMTTHGRAGPGRWVYGSVAEGVLAHSPVPVLLLQSWLGERPWRRLHEKARLLVPLDGSPFAEAALPVAIDFIQQFGGELQLVQAVPPQDDLVADAAAGVPLVVQVGEAPPRAPKRSGTWTASPSGWRSCSTSR
jgi:nucleotide-binding universal stress UspA family protein